MNDGIIRLNFQGSLAPFKIIKSLFCCLIISFASRSGGIPTFCALFVMVVFIKPCLAGLLTSFGFIRWVFVIPELANYAVNHGDVTSLNIIIESNIKLIHSYSGVALGENLAFIFQGLWLVLLAIDLHIHHTEDKKVAMPPFFIGLGIIIYSLEQFGGVFSGLGFINIPLQGAWLIWLLAFAWALINSTKRKTICLTFREGLGYSGAFVILMLLAH